MPLRYFIQKTFLFLKRKFKLQATFLLIAHTDGSAMQENGILDDGKTQTGATHLAAASLIYPIETLEKTGEMLGRNSLTVITEDEMPLIALLLGTQRYLTPFAGYRADCGYPSR